MRLAIAAVDRAADAADRTAKAPAVARLLGREQAGAFPRGVCHHVDVQDALTTSLSTSMQCDHGQAAVRPHLVDQMASKSTDGPTFSTKWIGSGSVSRNTQHGSAIQLSKLPASPARLLPEKLLCGRCSQAALKCYSKSHGEFPCTQCNGLIITSVAGLATWQNLTSYQGFRSLRCVHSVRDAKHQRRFPRWPLEGSDDNSREL